MLRALGVSSAVLHRHRFPAALLGESVASVFEREEQFSALRRVNAKSARIAFVRYLDYALLFQRVLIRTSRAIALEQEPIAEVQARFAHDELLH